MSGDDAARARAVLDGGLLDRLRERYGRPARSYHSFAHAADVAARASSLGADRACLLAAWFHDAVYDPGADDNEDRSAQILLDWLEGDPDADRAAALVRVTASHRPPSGDEQAAVLSDADLAVLGGDPVAYERYRLAVRAEFAAFDDEQWAVGRAAVLRDLLDRDRLFATAAGRQRWERTARRNIAAELASLE